MTEEKKPQRLCKTCTFCSKSGPYGVYLVCTRYAPKTFSETTGDAQWPLVAPYAGCGEWEAKADE